MNVAEGLLMRFILAGDPALVDNMKEGEGVYETDLTSKDPYVLAMALENAGHWVRRMQIRYPDHRIDLYIEVGLEFRDQPKADLQKGR